VNLQPQLSSTAPQVVSREALISAITTFLSGWDTLDEITACLSRELDSAGPRALIRLSRALSTAGGDWSYFERDPLARRIHQVLADRILLPASSLHGREHLAVFVEHVFDDVGRRELIERERVGIDRFGRKRLPLRVHRHDGKYLGKEPRILSYSPS